MANHVPQAEFEQLDKISAPLLTLFSRRLQGNDDSLGQQVLHGTPYDQSFSTNGASPHVQAFVKDVTTAVPFLDDLGMEITAVTDTDSWQVVAGFLPVGLVGGAGHTPGLISLDASEQPTLNAAGSATNQWERISYADQLKRVLPEVDGSELNIGGRIEIGVISDSINQVGGGVATSQASGDLPPGTRVTVLDDGPPGLTDEGRAMAELVYDLGPEFNILFHSGWNSPADMAAAFDELRQNGADIITDDISWFSEPVFQDGQIAQAIDDVYLNHGVLAFGSAGNHNGESYFNSWQDADGNGIHNFSGGDETINVTLNNNEELRVVLQWSQPWGSASTDIDIEVWDASISSKVADSNTGNVNGNPFDFLSFTNTSGSAADFHLIFRHVTGSSPAGLTLSMVAPGNADDFTNTYVQHEPGISGNHAARWLFALGAVPSTSPDAIESFSSHGPNIIYFSDSGAPLSTPIAREKPDFTAADRVATSVPGFGSFYGTSAASPNAAAVAGLVLDAADRSLTYTELSNIFAQTAVGTGTGSWDPVHGEGRINALGAGLVANGIHNREVYLELNQFGYYEVNASLSSNAELDSFLFALDNPGATQIQIDADLSPDDLGAILWNAESSSFVEIDYDDGSGYDPQFDSSLASWRLYQVDVFAEGDLSAVGSADYGVIVSGPSPAVLNPSVDVFGQGSTTGSISSADSDYFEFVSPIATDGDLTIVLVPQSSLNATLTLFDAAGNRLATADSAGSGGTETLTYSGVTPGQSFVVRVGSVQYASTGNFDLAVDFSVVPAELAPEYFLVPPAPLNAGEPISVEFSVTNSSILPAVGFEVNFYLTNEDVFGIDRVFVGAHSLAGLGSQSTTETITKPLVLPSLEDPVWIGDGTYHLEMVVDANNNVEETNETNNTVQDSLFVNAPLRTAGLDMNAHADGNDGMPDAIVVSQADPSAPLEILANGLTVFSDGYVGTVAVTGSGDADSISLGQGMVDVFYQINGGGGEDLIDVSFVGAATGALDGGSGLDSIVDLQLFDLAGAVAWEYTLQGDLLRRRYDTTTQSGIGHGVFNLAGLETANVVARTEDTTFILSDWPSQASVTGGAGTDRITVAQNADFSLADDSLTRSTSGPLALAGIEDAELTGGLGDNRFDLSEWTGTATIDGGPGIDHLTTSRSGRQAIQGLSLLRNGCGVVTLSSIEEAALTGGFSADELEATDWPGLAILDGEYGNDSYIVGFLGSGSGTTVIRESVLGGNDDLTVNAPVSGTTPVYEPLQVFQGAETVSFDESIENVTIDAVAKVSLGMEVLLEVDATRHVHVVGDAQVSGETLLAILGGSVSAGNLINNGEIHLLGFDPLIGDGTLSNQGVLLGTGEVRARLHNLDAGEVRANDGQRIVFTGADGINQGEIALSGGEIQFAKLFTNDATGFIAGRGGLEAVGGLVNNGTMAFSGGTMNLYGQLNNQVGGRVVVSGGSTLIVHDELIHDGEEIRTGIGRTVVFAADVQGSGPFTGLGTSVFEANLKPGNVTAAIALGGDLVLQPLARLEIELAGLARGSQFDAIDI
ncbi:MAG: CARDB domain-containing protein, partial [Pirellulaceae bacterium]